MKNTIKAITLMAVLMLGTTFSMAAGGILVSDKKTNECTTRTQTEGIIVFGAKDGIIVFGITGIIVFGNSAEGIIVFGGKENEKQCTDRNGILVSD